MTKVFIGKGNGKIYLSDEYGRVKEVFSSMEECHQWIDHYRQDMGSLEVIEGKPDLRGGKMIRLKVIEKGKEPVVFPECIAFVLEAKVGEIWPALVLVHSPQSLAVIAVGADISGELSHLLRKEV